jgi:hypothetical protein
MEAAETWSLAQIRRTGVLTPKLLHRYAKSGKDPKDVVKAVALRDRMLDLASGTNDDLPRLARLRVSKEVLYMSGLGHILQDTTIWWKSGSLADVKFAQALRQKWQAQLRGKPLVHDKCTLSCPSLKGFKADFFYADVLEMRIWLLSMDSPQVPFQMAGRIALVLALHGFKVPGHLRGLLPGDLLELFEEKSALAVLRRGMEKLENSNMEGRLALNWSTPSGSNQTAVVKSSAEELASILAPAQYEQAEASIAALELGLGVSGSSTSLKPFDAIEKLGLAKAAGKDVDLLLAAKAENFRDLSVQGSYASVASALRCWHRFATLFLGYPEASTLPPKEAEHVVKFLAIFRKAKTAENYIGAIKWAGIRTQLPITWRDATLAQGLAGAKRRSITMIGEAAQQAFFLTHEIMVQLAQMLLQMEVPPGMAVLAVIAWQFLLRVQGEGVPLLRGLPSSCNGLPNSMP